MRANDQARTSLPWLPAGALIAAVGAGLALFWVGDAPPSYSLVNGGALLVALAAMVAAGRARCGRTCAVWIVALGIAGIAATLVAGPDIDGVRRWIALGPVRLHAAMLLLPAVLAALPRLRGNWRLAPVAGAATVFAVQPDPAAALALVCGCALSEWYGRRSAASLLVLLVAIAGLAAALVRDTPLEPVPFVESVVQDGFALQPALGVLLATTLLFAIAAPMFMRGSDRAVNGGIAGCWLGFAAASLLGPYPTPLAGYGAAAIGYGLAIAVSRAIASFRIGSG
ncbi:hypothetical protein [Pelagerythrobacter sp.]|uniref:hypothetical protein n=1 Tax=Pelagerythrobacter sp. TaxID=2800702 RepID=UPI0035B23AD5